MTEASAERHWIIRDHFQCLDCGKNWSFVYEIDGASTTRGVHLLSAISELENCGIVKPRRRFLAGLQRRFFKRATYVGRPCWSCIERSAA